ncbi:hypothetical protein MIMGU_mgv11b008016mg [Erythranthe guttata]|uniref:Leucine-rich repeat-containing N-terminal plant-type domain-containing protein n=1 Tax=Erythranthe guttata TaxID=4155 RepID=A0A022RDX2_ERYGU|nr:hypothetical protein MIMGU_mgv11b008016mg [Erythranthe guttata]
MFFPRFLGLICLLGFASGAALLPPDEVISLQVVAKSLGKTDWNFSVDPCSGLSGWVILNPAIKEFENTLTCDCTFDNNTVCHVISIILKAQNLQGTVPRELVRLPFLKEIDLTRNYLNGTIPPEWGSMNLVNISLLGNRVTGPIPKALANISTLANLTIEYNQLTGPIPPEFGDLPQLERLLVTSNNLTGELPANLAKLTTLRDFRISDNSFSGSIPNFIQNWTNIEKLRISDLSGNVSTFPDLSNIKKLKTLILRSCNIIGELPSYLGGMKTLKVLDLSFNKLSGPIPDTYIDLANTDYIYLTGNSLSGPLPEWMMKDGDRMNLFASSKGNTS